MTGSSSSRRLGRLLGDLGIALGALYLAFQVRLSLPIPGVSALLPPEKLEHFGLVWPAALVAQGVALWLVGLYEKPRPLGRLELARRLAIATLIQGAIFIGWLFFVERAFPRSVLLLYLAIAAAGLFLWRFLLQWLQVPVERQVAIVGCGTAARELAAAIERHHWHGLRVRGFVAAPAESLPSGIEPGVRELGENLGGIERLAELLAEGELDDILFASDPHSWQSVWLDRLARARPAHAAVLLLPGPFESLIGRMRYRWVHDLPLIEVVRDTEWRVSRPLKRGLDLLGAFLLLVLAAPLLLGVALVVRLTSAGPVFYRQERVGRGLRRFTLLKFRTMIEAAEQGDEELLAVRDDPRLTPVGGFLRRARLDELPQLLNVLAGQMSLVGPRPERPGFVERFLVEVPGYSERFAVAPGLTGLAQVNGEYDSSAQNKLRYDLAYLANWSPWLDLSILIRTLRSVLTARGL